MQLKYFIKDINRILGKQKLRIILIFFSRTFWGVFLYRFERSCYLLLGEKCYRILRFFLIPLYVPIIAYSNFDIHYKANILGGLLVLQPSLGVVISGKCVIGENLTLVGGNCIGIEKWEDKDQFIIGNNCTLGANATIIGPIQLGNGIQIGASACVVKTFMNDNLVLVGVPAKIV